MVKKKNKNEVLPDDLSHLHNMLRGALSNKSRPISQSIPIQKSGIDMERNVRKLIAHLIGTK